jgi:hypothetical protein
MDVGMKATRKQRRSSITMISSMEYHVVPETNNDSSMNTSMPALELSFDGLGLNSNNNQ